MELLTSALMCLALNIYNEARGEPLEGQYKVAQVTLNRVQSPKWKDTICDVVYEEYQFSWTLKRFNITDEKSLDIAIAIAVDTIKTGYPTTTCADHYHTTAISPYWAKDMKVESIIGNHIFYCSED